MVENGDWIEVGDKIFEITKIFKKHYMVREVLYKSYDSYKLKYGMVYPIRKEVIIWEK